MYTWHCGANPRDWEKKGSSYSHFSICILVHPSDVTQFIHSLSSLHCLTSCRIKYCTLQSLNLRKLLLTPKLFIMIKTLSVLYGRVWLKGEFALDLTAYTCILWNFVCKVKKDFHLGGGWLACFYLSLHFLVQVRKCFWFWKWCQWTICTGQLWHKLCSGFLNLWFCWQYLRKIEMYMIHRKLQITTAIV